MHKFIKQNFSDVEMTEKNKIPEVIKAEKQIHELV